MRNWSASRRELWAPKPSRLKLVRQAAMATPSARSGRYATWSKVLEASSTCSQTRIASAGLFDASSVDVVRTALAARQHQLDRIEATPLLDDATTKNVIVAPDGKFSGIVDVDDLCFGDPRYPGALTLAVLHAYGGPSAYVWAWLRHGTSR